MPAPCSGTDTQRIGTETHPTNERAAAEGVAETEALSVTHWLDTEQDGEPYAATIRFTGRRMGVRGKPGPRDAFVKEETVDGIVPGSGQVSVTTWVYGLQPGEWTVSADLTRGSARAGTRRASAGGKPPGAHTLPRAAWSWRRWALSTGHFAPVKTRWGPLVRLTRMPAVVPGSWSGLIGLGVLVGVALQAALLARANVPVRPSLLVDLVAFLAALIGAKLWYVVLRPRGARRQSIAEGWTVDGFLLAIPPVAAALLTFNLPIGTIFDVSTPSLFFGIAIGRFGCFFTGCCAGRCTRSRWSVWSSNRRIGARRIPAQLLESLAGLFIGLATLLLVLDYEPAVQGAIFVGAFAVYIIARQFLLRLREEPHNRVRAQVTAAAAALVLVTDVVVVLVSTG